MLVINLMYLETSSKWHRKSHLRMRQGRLVSSFPGVKLLRPPRARGGGGDIPAVLGTSGGCVVCIFWQQTSLHCSGKSLFSPWKTTKSWEIANWILSFSLRRDSGNQNAAHCRSMFCLHCQLGHCQLGLCEQKRVDSITGTATLLFHVTAIKTQKLWYDLGLPN